MVWIVTVAGMGFVAVALLWIGLRGRRIDDHPWCRRCKYDLVGSEEGLAPCPECGRDLTHLGAIRHGRRRRRPLVAAIGVLVLALAVSVVGLTVGLTTLGGSWNARLPIWVLLLEAEWGDTLSAERALAELRTRQRNGRLSRDERNQVVNRALDIQADQAKRWRLAWGALVEQAANPQKLTRDQWDRYARNAAAFDLVVQSPVRQGDPLLRKMVMNTRVGPQRRFNVQATHEACSIDGKNLPDPHLYELESSVRCAATPSGRQKPMEWYVTPFLVYGAFPNRTQHDSSPAEVTLAPGRYRYECRWRFSVRAVTIQTPLAQAPWAPAAPSQPSWDVDPDFVDDPEAETEQEEPSFDDEWTICFSREFVVLPPDAETIAFVRDEALRDRIRESIIVRRCTVRRLSQGDWLSGIVEFDDPPVACAFDVYFQVADQRWLLGSVCSTTLGPYGGFQPTICRLREFVMPAGISHLDVVLVPNRDVAAQSFGTTRIWGEPVVIERVPVTWHDGVVAVASP